MSEQVGMIEIEEKDTWLSAIDWKGCGDECFVCLTVGGHGSDTVYLQKESAIKLRDWLNEVIEHG